MDGGPPPLLLLVAVVVCVDEVLKLRAPEVRRPDAEDEADGIHEVRLAGAVGADDGCEVVEGPNGLVALVRLEVVELQAVDLAA